MSNSSISSSQNKMGTMPVTRLILNMSLPMMFFTKKLTFFLKNGPKKSFLNILLIGNNSEIRIQNY